MLGPVQMLILGFEDPQFKGEALAELQKLRDADIIRVIDAMVVWKDAEGNVAVLQDTDLSGEEMGEFGGIVGGLIGLGMAGEEGLEAGAEAGARRWRASRIFDDEDVWYAVDAIPEQHRCRDRALRAPLGDPVPRRDRARGRFRARGRVDPREGPRRRRPARGRGGGGRGGSGVVLRSRSAACGRSAV